MRLPFSSNTLWTLGIANEEGIEVAPSSTNIILSCCAAFIPPHIPGE